MKMRDLLSDESKWLKGAFAALANGRGCSSTDPDAIRWCLVGARVRVYGWLPKEEYEKLCSKMEEQVPDGCVTNWNDAPERTFEEVKALLDRLDI